RRVDGTADDVHRDEPHGGIGRSGSLLYRAVLLAHVQQVEGEHPQGGEQAADPDQSAQGRHRDLHRASAGRAVLPPSVVALAAARQRLDHLDWLAAIGTEARPAGVGRITPKGGAAGWAAEGERGHSRSPQGAAAILKAVKAQKQAAVPRRTVLADRRANLTGGD